MVVWWWSAERYVTLVWWWSAERYHYRCGLKVVVWSAERYMMWQRRALYYRRGFIGSTV